MWRNLWAPTLWRIKRMASHNYFKWQKKYNNIKLVNNWIKYKLDPDLWKPLVTNSAWNSGMVDDVTSPSCPQYFLIGFRRFTKITFERSGGRLYPPSPPQWRRPWLPTLYNMSFGGVVKKKDNSSVKNRLIITELESLNTKRIKFDLVLMFKLISGEGFFLIWWLFPIFL